jgi:hypothetical protein
LAAGTWMTKAPEDGRADAWADFAAFAAVKKAE